MVAVMVTYCGAAVVAAMVVRSYSVVMVGLWSVCGGDEASQSQYFYLSLITCESWVSSVQEGRERRVKNRRGNGQQEEGREGERTRGVVPPVPRTPLPLRLFPYS